MTAALLVIGALSYAALHAVRLSLAWRYLRRERVSPPPDTPRPVTVIQPILSGDPDLEGSLAANLRAAPLATFVWVLDEDDAEGLRVAHRLAGSRAGVRIEALRAPRDGENPKMLKLIHAVSQLAEGTVMVLDDDTVLAPGDAARLAAHAEGALATAMPIWNAPPRTCAEALVAGFVNGQGASAYFAAAALRRGRTINGMAYAIDAADLSRLGGFGAAGHEVTDDLAVARLALSSGLPLRQTAIPAQVAVTLRSVGEALAVLRRWMRFAGRYLAAHPDGAVLSLVAAPPILALAGLIVAAHLGPAAVAAWLVLVVVRAAANARLIRSLSGHRSGKGGILAAAMAELLLPLLALLPLWRPSRIRWRGRQMELSSGAIRYR